MSIIPRPRPVGPIPSRNLGPINVGPVPSENLGPINVGPFPIQPLGPTRIQPLTPPARPLRAPLVQVPEARLLEAAPFLSAPILDPRMSMSGMEQIDMNSFKCSGPSQYQCNVNGVTVVQTPLIPGSYIFPMMYNTGAYQKVAATPELQNKQATANLKSCLKKN